MKPSPLSPTEKLLDKVGQALNRKLWNMDAATSPGCKWVISNMFTVQAPLCFPDKQVSRHLKTLLKIKWKCCIFLSVYLQSSKVEPGDESASCLRSSSLSRVTWRSWYKIVSSFSLICLVSITGGGDDALPVVPEEERNTWQWANVSKEQHNFTKEVNTYFKKSCISVCRILLKKWSNSYKFSSVSWKKSNSSQIPC